MFCVGEIYVLDGFIDVAINKMFYRKRTHSDEFITLLSVYDGVFYENV